MTQTNEKMNILETLGRFVLVLILLYSSIEIFAGKLIYNWWFLFGSFAIIGWAYLPLGKWSCK